MNLMTYNDFKSLLNSSMGNYYKGRWKYFKEVIKIIKNENIKSVLEIGPGLLPIVKDSDILLNPQDDHFGKPNEYHGKVIIHDITIKPWPIKDKEYDLLIALQVWEHLDNKQSRAFREAARTSKMAILSFPYLWEGGKEKSTHRAHRNIDKELIGDWTLNIKPEKIIEIPKTGHEFSKGSRLIYFWKFDKEITP